MMDIETFEQLEQKVEKAKIIRDSVRKLYGRIERIEKTTSITFADNETCVSLAIIKRKHGEIDEAISAALIKTFKEVAIEQIEKLEKEFAEI